MRGRSGIAPEDGAVADQDKARREVAKPDGFVSVNPGMRFEIQEGGELAQGQFKLLEHATAEMQASGPNAAMSGTDPRELAIVWAGYSRATGWRCGDPLSRSPTLPADVEQDGLRGRAWMQRRVSIGRPDASCM